MISKPHRGTDILDWCQRLWDDLQPIFRAKPGLGIILKTGAPAWQISSKTTAAPFALFPYEYGVRDDGITPYVRFSYGYACIRILGEESKWFVTPNDSEPDDDIIYAELELETGDNYAYAQLEITGDNLSDGELTLQKNVDTTQTEDFPQALKDIKDEARMFRRLLCMIRVKAGEHGGPPEVKMEDIYHSGVWDITPAITDLDICTENGLQTSKASLIPPEDLQTQS